MSPPWKFTLALLEFLLHYYLPVLHPSIHSFIHFIYRPITPPRHKLVRPRLPTDNSFDLFHYV